VILKHPTHTHCLVVFSCFPLETRNLPTIQERHSIDLSLPPSDDHWPSNIAGKHMKKREVKRTYLHIMYYGEIRKLNVYIGEDKSNVGAIKVFRRVKYTWLKPRD
jgi:hypothetical protein